MEPAVRKKSTGTSPLFLWKPKMNRFMVLFEWFQHFKCEIAMWFFILFSACRWCWHASNERLQSWLPSLSLVSLAWFLFSLPNCCLNWRPHRFTVLYEFVNLCSIAVLCSSISGQRHVSQLNVFEIPTNPPPPKLHSKTFETFHGAIGWMQGEIPGTDNTYCWTANLWCKLSSLNHIIVRQQL